MIPQSHCEQPTPRKRRCTCIRNAPYGRCRPTVTNHLGIHRCCIGNPHKAHPQCTPGSNPPSIMRASKGPLPFDLLSPSKQTRGAPYRRTSLPKDPAGSLPPGSSLSPDQARSIAGSRPSNPPPQDAALPREAPTQAIGFARTGCCWSQASFRPSRYRTRLPDRSPARTSLLREAPHRGRR